MSDKQSSNRRDFLTGRAAGQAAADAIERAADHVGQFADRFAPPRDTSKVESPGYVTTLKRRAMACDFEIRLNARSGDDEGQVAAALEALDQIDQLESQLTVYRTTSELIEINKRAASEPVGVEPGLFGLLVQADELYRQTAGAFDATAGPLSRAWGFDRRAGRMPTDDELDTARQHVGWEKVKLDTEQRQVRFTQSGVEINVNSIGKGYALDQAAGLLHARGVEDFLFHGGRSTLLAHGSRSGDVGWIARLRHPLRPQERIAEFRLRDQALSTSGSATQSFIHGDRRYGHIIDPRTGWPAEGLYSATVIAPTATLADALSTAFYVMGPAATAQYCATRPLIKALLVLPAERAGEVELKTVNLKSHA